MDTRRIALVTETFYPAVDGTTTTLKQLADHLIDAGHEVLLVAPGPGLATYRRSQVARIRPLDRPGRQVREALARFEPDLVHAVSPGTLGRKALKHARRLGVPTLVVQHTPPTELARRSGRPRSRPAPTGCSSPPTSSPAACTSSASTPPCGSPGSTPAPSRPQLRDHWLHDKWSRARSRDGPPGRRRLRRQPAQAPRRTPPRRGRGPARHPARGHRRRPPAGVAATPRARGAPHRRRC